MLEAALTVTMVAVLVVALYLVANAFSRLVAERLYEGQKPRRVKLKGICSGRH